MQLAQSACSYLRKCVVPHTPTNGMSTIFSLTRMPQPRIELIIVQFHLLGGPNSGRSMFPTIFPIILSYPVFTSSVWGKFSVRVSFKRNTKISPSTTVCNYFCALSSHQCASPLVSWKSANKDVLLDLQRLFKLQSGRSQKCRNDEDEVHQKVSGWMMKTLLLTLAVLV